MNSNEHMRKICVNYNVEKNYINNNDELILVIQLQFENIHVSMDIVDLILEEIYNEEKIIYYSDVEIKNVETFTNVYIKVHNVEKLENN